MESTARQLDSQNPPQPEGGAPLSAQEKIRRLATGVVRDLLPAPAAIAVQVDPEILGSNSKIDPRKLARSEKCTDRLLADHSEANGRPRTLVEQPKAQARTLGGPATDRPRTLAEQPRDSGTASLRLRSRRQESSKGDRKGRDRARASTGGGGQFRNRRSGVESGADRNKIDAPIPPRDPFPRRCPLCRKRKRQSKGYDKKSGERMERLLCGPCQRMLRICHWDRAWQQRRFILLDPPAPLCHSCWHRPRISKGTRRGRPRYFHFCGPCERARRVALGKPAYRGERGRRMQAEDELRPVEERNRYPYPKAERESVYARSSSWEELLAPPKPKAPATIGPQPRPARPEPLPSIRRRRGRRRNYRLIALWAIADAWRAIATISTSTRAKGTAQIAEIVASVEPVQAVDHATLLHIGRLVEVLPVDRVASRRPREVTRPAGFEHRVTGPTNSRPPPRGAAVLRLDPSPPYRDRQSASAKGRIVA